MIVAIVFIEFGFVWCELARVGVEFGVAAVAAEVPLGVKLDELMLFMAVEAAGEADAGSLGGVHLGFAATCQAGVECLPLDVALEM